MNREIGSSGDPVIGKPKYLPGNVAIAIIGLKVLLLIRVSN
jgi:hypothetical protein